MTKRITSLILILALLAASAAFVWASAQEDYVIERFTSEARLSLWSKKSNSDGLVFQSSVWRTPGGAALWRDTVKNAHVTSPAFSVTDWRGFSLLNLWVRSDSETNSAINVILYSGGGGGSGVYFRATVTVDWTGWRLVSLPLSGFRPNGAADWSYIHSMRLDATGWGVSSSPDTVLYLDTIWAASRYNTNEPAEAFSAVSGSVTAVRCQAGGSMLWSGSVAVSFREALGAEPREQEGTILVPAAFFPAFFGAAFTREGSDALLSGNGRTLRLSPGSKRFFRGDSPMVFSVPVLEDGGECYIPMEESLQALGYEVLAFSDTVAAGDAAAIARLRTEEALRARLLEEMTSRPPPAPAQADFETAKNHWRRFLAGDAPPVSAGGWARVSAIDSAAQSLWDRLNLQSGIRALWGTEVTTTNRMTSHYESIYKMALAYATPGGGLYQNAALRGDILAALEWMYLNLYGQKEIEGKGWRKTGLYNWHDWQVGSPKHLVNTLMLLEDYVPPQKITAYLSLFHHVVPLSDGSATKAYNCIGAGLLEGSAAAVDEGKESVAHLLRFRTNSPGFHEDGSYLTHRHHPYNGHYGTSMLLSITPVRTILDGTAFQIGHWTAENQTKWVLDVFTPILYKGGSMSMVNGRRPNPSEHSQGFFIIQCFLALSERMKPSDRERVRAIIAHHVRNEPKTDYYKNLSLYEISILDSILGDGSLDEYRPLFGKVYYNMDRVVHHREGFSAGLAMSSSRVYNYESINHINKTAWYTGDGMLYIYQNEGTRYEREFWDTVNPYRMPGTTVDTQIREAASIIQGREYLSPKDFAGGVTDGTYTTAAMWLDAYSYEGDENPFTGDYGGSPPAHNSTLEAKKAWFFFDDEVVALGAGITANDGFPVETIVENQHQGSRALSVNGQPAQPPENQQPAGQTALWASLGGTGGYFFPGGAPLSYRATTTAPAYTELWLSHGVSPQNKTYAYALLPGKTEAETAAYAQDPDIAILSNTPNLQAVKERTAGVTGMVFWAAGKSGDVTVNNPLLVMAREDGEDFTLWVSDPTHKLSQAVVILSRRDVTAYEWDEGVTPLRTADGYRFTLHLSAQPGKSLGIRFKKVYPQDGLLVSKPYFTDKNGAPVSRLAPDSVVGAVILADNMGQAPKNVTAVFTLYEQNRLAQLTQDTRTLSPGEGAQLRFFRPVWDQSGLRAFLWRDLQSLAPLTEDAIRKR